MSRESSHYISSKKKGLPFRLLLAYGDQLCPYGWSARLDEAPQNSLRSFSFSILDLSFKMDASEILGRKYFKVLNPIRGINTAFADRGHAAEISLGDLAACAPGFRVAHSIMWGFPMPTRTTRLHFHSLIAAFPPNAPKLSDCGADRGSAW
jgi:hypothetical protein